MIVEPPLRTANSLDILSSILLLPTFTCTHSMRVHLVFSQPIAARGAVLERTTRSILLATRELPRNYQINVVH
jgi:hypothetical protein